MPSKLSHQLVVRITDDLKQAIERDAEANGRTPAQTARHWLKKQAETQAKVDGPIRASADV